LLFLSLC